MEEVLVPAADGVVVAGELVLPNGQPRAVILMHPGSGPADRTNGGYFPQIRDHLVSSGFAVAAFDKRGAGRSTGAWHTSSVEQQAHDVNCIVAELRRRLPDIKVGLFGHSQGSWVVTEAVARGGLPVDFVILNSGPAIGPREQTRYDIENTLVGKADATSQLAAYDALIELLMADASFADASKLHRDVIQHFEVDELDWINCQILFGYEPTHVQPPTPVLAIFGELDALVPVPASAKTFDSHDNTEVCVLSRADHRLQDEQGIVVPGYWPALDSFLAKAAVE